MAGLGREVGKEEARARFWEEVLSFSKGKILLCESGWGDGETDSAWDECLFFSTAMCSTPWENLDRLSSLLR